MTVRETYDGFHSGKKYITNVTKMYNIRFSTGQKFNLTDNMQEVY